MCPIMRNKPPDKLRRRCGVRGGKAGDACEPSSVGGGTEQHVPQVISCVFLPASEFVSISAFVVLELVAKLSNTVAMMRIDKPIVAQITTARSLCLRQPEKTARVVVGTTSNNIQKWKFEFVQKVDPSIGNATKRNGVTKQWMPQTKAINTAALSSQTFVEVVRCSVFIECVFID